MWKRSVPIIVVLLPFLLAIDCGGDGSGNGDVTGPTGGITLNEQIACMGECFTDAADILDVLIHVLKKVDAPAYGLPPGIYLNVDPAVLEFEADLQLRSVAGIDILRGTIRPPPSNTGACSNGMQQGDVCVFEWDVTEGAAGPAIALGTFSAVELGPPTDYAATRYTIVDRNAEVHASDDCGMVISGFDMMWHLMQDDLYSFYLGFTLHYSESGNSSALDGSVIWASGAGSDADLTFTVGTETYNCTFDVETFVLSCPNL